MSEDEQRRERNRERVRNYMREDYNKRPHYKEYQRNYNADYYRNKNYSQVRKERKMRLYSIEVDDGRNNVHPLNKKYTPQTEMAKIEWTSELEERFYDYAIEWLNDAYVFDDKGNINLRYEVPRYGLHQLCAWIKHVKNEDFTKKEIDNRRKVSIEFDEMMADFDANQEDLLVTYSTANKVNANIGKFILTNRFKENWKDTKVTENRNINEQYIITEVVAELPSASVTKTLYSGDEDFFDFEDVDDDKN